MRLEVGMENKLLNAALRYAEVKGWRIHPCRPDKRPYLYEWQKKASCDPEQIREWWQEYPDALIGCATGPDSGIWVLDADLPDGPAEAEKMRLPETLMQQTGSGGFQYIWQWNGHNIRNSSRRIAKDCDVRGDGGYCILPPSPHPSGGQYKWANKADIVHAPEWLARKAESPPEPDISLPAGSSKYGLGALNQEVIKLSTAGEGNRNEALNSAAFNVGQLIGGGELDHDHAYHSLSAIATTLGLSQSEIKKTLNSGLKSGMQKPRSAPERGDIQYDLNVGQQSQQSQQSHNWSAEVSTGQQKSAKVIKSQQESAGESPEPPHNLRAAIFEFIKNSTGSFTTRDIDTEFGLTTRKEKNARARSLVVARERQLIKKDKRAAGKYHIIDNNIEFIDLDNVSEEEFPIQLPFGLHNYVKIPKHSIIILAGSSNAGKTALILETLRLNIKQKYDKHYYMSEMGPGEYKGRVMNFDMPLSDWKKIKAASKSYDFESAIQSHNPDGLTCIDFLEEVDGEYFKIASSIREIYDALGKGVAMVAIQKKRGSEVAFGGEATTQKARLYLVLDFLASRENSIVCALKVYKLKAPRGFKSLINHEMHFEIHSGSKFNVLMDWTPCSKVDRIKASVKYESGREDIGANDFMFRTVEGQVVRLKEDQWRQWQEHYTINVENELTKLMQSNDKRPFLKHKNYVFQLTGILTKKENGE